MFSQEMFFECLKAHGMKPAGLAEKLGISRVTLWRKVSGESEFTLSEICKCRELFGPKWCDKIFFAPKVA